MTLLQVRGLSVAFSGLVALDEVDLDVERGSLVGLIGPNGAGKTTFIDALTGFVPATGHITFDGRRIDGIPPHRRATAGLARTWQSVKLFNELTVAENLDVAAARQRWYDPLLDTIRPGRHGRPDVQRALDALSLAHLADRVPEQLDQGDRKMVGVARALAGGPKLLLLDEPAAGLEPEASRLLGERLRRIVGGGTTILLVDHDMSLVLGVCDVVHVLEFGKKIAEGAPEHIRKDDRVVAAYLGAGGAS